MDIGPAKRIIEVEPVSLPLPEAAPEFVPGREAPVPGEPTPAEPAP